MIGEEFGDIRRTLCCVCSAREHVRLEPLPDKTFRERLGVLALLKQCRTVLLQDRSPSAQRRGILRALPLRAVELVKDRPRRDVALGRDELGVDRTN